MMSCGGEGEHVEETSGPELLLHSCRSWRHDEVPEDQLDRKWSLWYDFMKEHAHLEAWLRLAEEAIDPSHSMHVSYGDAKEELKKFERLRAEAAAHLLQLDSLTQRNRTLTRLFDGVMRARLLMVTRRCGRRWDEVAAQLEAAAGRLQHFVSEWEEFEAQGEELALWLANTSERLAEVDHMTGSTCEKLQRLQSFQECVCVNSGRVNALLQRGEALIQRSLPTDAQHVERRLLELLRHCSHVYNDIARTHTRLLSLKLVFEDDSGCSSEIPADDDAPLEVTHRRLSTSSFSLPCPPSPPTHEHLGLEWDPSVDIGRSVSQEDVDSCYFSGGGTGLCLSDADLKKWSFLSSFDSQSVMSNNDREDDEVSPAESLDNARHAPETPPLVQRRTTSTPDHADDELVCFDGRRVRAWLGAQCPASSEDAAGKAPDWLQPQGAATVQGRSSRGVEELLLPDQRASPPSSSSFWFLFLFLFLFALWLILQPPCRRSNRLSPTFHMTLHYVNGPPPT